MAGRDGFELAGLAKAQSAGTDLFGSDGSTLLECDGLRRSRTDSSRTTPRSFEESFSLTASQLETLVRTCVDAVTGSRSKDDVPLLDSGESSPRSKVDSKFDSKFEFQGTLDPAAPSGLPDIREEPLGFERYDHQTTERELMEKEEAWRGRKQEARWKAVLDSVEDVWEHYFPNCYHDAGDPNHANCHPLTDPALRLTTQKDLVLSRLCLEQDADNVKNAQRFLPWLSLIGFKVDQVHLLTRSFARTFVPHPYVLGGTRMQSCSIIAHILRYFNEGPFDYLGTHEEFLTGAMLSYLYRRQMLTRPANADDPLLEHNFRDLILGLWVLNIIQTPRYLLTFLYSWNEVEQCLPLIGFYVLNMRPLEAISKSFADIERAIQQTPAELPQSAGENVRCTDLHIQALRNIGGLKIVWTTCDRDHLFLDQENGVLRLSWFNRVLIPEFYKYMPILGRNDVVRTWELLLGHRKHQYDFADLDKIPLPPELIAFNKLPRSKPLFRRPSHLRASLSHSPEQVPDLWDKYGPLPNLPRSVPCNYFGRFEDRVRILRNYMDNRKPTGLRNLWHDKRDSLTYYTFWAVLIFGGVSVLLALLGLLVGILQTVAAFRALE